MSVVIENYPDGWAFECPACGFSHIFPGDGRWTFNGDFEKPTFSPSLLTRWTDAENNEVFCHSFVRDGKIEYCSDCPHEYAGKTIDMVPYGDVNNK